MKKLNREGQKLLKASFLHLILFSASGAWLLQVNSAVRAGGPVEQSNTAENSSNSRPGQLEREAETQRDPNLTLPCEKTDRQAFS